MSVFTIIASIIAGVLVWFVLDHTKQPVYITIPLAILMALIVLVGRLVVWGGALDGLLH